MRKILLLMLALVTMLTLVGCVAPDNAVLNDKINNLGIQSSEQANTIKDINDTLNSLVNKLAAQEQLIAGQKEASAQELKDIKEDIGSTQTEINNIITAIDGLKEQLALKDKNEEMVKEFSQVVEEARASVALIKEEFDSNRKHYTINDIIAVQDLFVETNAAIVASTNSIEIETHLTNLENSLGKYQRVDDQVYQCVLNLVENFDSKNITTLKKDADKLLSDAKAFYGKDEALTKYNAPDGVINLVKAIENFDAAKTMAEAINTKINKFYPFRQTSIKNLIVNIGGYYKTFGNDLIKLTDVELEDSKKETIATFMIKYAQYGFETMIDSDKYNELYTTIEANITKMENNLGVFLEKYESIKDEEIEINVDSLDTIYTLKVFYDSWNMIGSADFEKAIYYDNSIKMISILSAFDITTKNLNKKIVEVKEWIDKAEVISTRVDKITEIYELMDALCVADSATLDFDNFAPANALTNYGILSLTSTEKTVNNITNTYWTVEYILTDLTIKEEEIKFNGTKAEFLKANKDKFYGTNEEPAIIKLAKLAWSVEDTFTEDEYDIVVEARNGWFSEATNKGFTCICYLTYISNEKFAEHKSAFEWASTYDDLRSVVFKILGDSDESIVFGDLIIY